MLHRQLASQSSRTTGNFYVNLHAWHETSQTAAKTDGMHLSCDVAGIEIEKQSRLCYCSCLSFF